MGFYTSVYVGVYMEVPKGQQEVEIVEYNDNETGFTTKHKFSPNNGEPNEKVVKTETREIYPDPYELGDGKYEDEFLSFEFCGAKAGYETWVPNTNKYGKKIDIEKLTNVDLVDVDGHSAIVKFKNENSEFLSDAEAEYPGIRVIYGVAMYAS